MRSLVQKKRIARTFHERWNSLWDAHMHGGCIPALEPLDELGQQRGPLSWEVVAGDHRQGLAQLRTHQGGRGQHEPCQKALDLLLHGRAGHQCLSAACPERWCSLIHACSHGPCEQAPVMTLHRAAAAITLLSWNAACTRDIHYSAAMTVDSETENIG